MTTFYIILALCAIGQGFFKDISDALMSGKFQDAFGVKNPNGFFGTTSWTRKYKNGDVKQGEAFLFSSSILVFLTDAWHLSNSFEMLCNMGCLVLVLNLNFTLTMSIAVALVYWFLRSGTHHVMFTWCYAIIKRIRLKNKKT
jgi:hypothetical protein